MTNKMTYVTAIDSALNGNITDEVREKLETLKVQLEKRHSGERKPTKVQKENESLKEDIFAYISENGAKRATDVAIYFGISGQKASALLKQIVESGRFEKYTEKRVTYFRVAEGC
jgi:predicted HTH transcriptional regulator